MIEIYETPYGNVKINVDSHRAIVNVSSGFDSALMLYLVALAARKYNPEIEIHTVTARRMNSLNEPHLKEVFDRVDNYANAVKVVDWVKNIFPDLDIRENLLYDSYFWQYCQDDPILGRENTYVLAQTMPGIYVRLLPYPTKKFTYKTITYNGITKNPDFDLGGDNPEKHRNNKELAPDLGSLTVTTEQDTGPFTLVVSPYRNGDKRVTFWLADHVGILDDLLDKTRSCEGNRTVSNNWTEECCECWWCYERIWANETYKNQEPAEQDKYKSDVYFKSLKGTR
jgi:hypothetical protein